MGMGNDVARHSEQIGRGEMLGSQNAIHRL